jgi:DNA-directed RNA polymerase specialized sigma24 family protein
VDTRSATPWTEIGQDTERLRLAQRGDRDALLQLFAAYQLPLWRACLAITHQHGEADRLYEHTIACASHELASAPVGQPLLLWLVRLARELDAHRARTSPRDPALAGTQRPDGQPWDERAPDVDVERHALRAYAQLDPDDQWLLALRLFERLSYADIARVSGRSVEEVVERLSFARDEIDGGLDAEEKAA